MPIHLHAAFGLVIRSEIDLAPLTSIKSRPEVHHDVMVRRVDSPDLFPKECLALLHAKERVLRPFIRHTEDEIYLIWDEVGIGKVAGGQEIIAYPLPGVYDEILRLYIVGSSLSVILHQHGLLPLHASVVAVDNEAVAFLGEWGAGKSTTAAAMVKHGHSLIADDIAAVEMCGRHPVVSSGIPWMKLWPESVRAFDLEPENLPLIDPDIDKRLLHVAIEHSQARTPLRCLYVLDDGPQLDIQSIPRNIAMQDLLANWYGSRFGRGFLNQNERVRLFQQVTHLLATVPTFRLCRPDELRLLNEMAASITEHAMTLRKS